MATRKRSTSSDEPGRLTASRATFGAELNARIERGAELLERVIHSADELAKARADYYTWDEYNAQLLKRRFTTDELYRAYVDSVFFGVAGLPLPDLIKEYVDDVQKKVRRLRSVLEQLELYEEPIEVSSTQASTATPADQPDARIVFVVHGHSDARKLEVMRFLSQVARTPAVVLHEQPNEGRTIIEKLEAVARPAGFAVVVLTADDEGRRRGTDDALLPRGRQNVVLELGYFMAKLGRSKVVILYESDVELPSDISGVLYVRMDDAGGWKLALAKELTAADISVDLNKAT